MTKDITMTIKLRTWDAAEHLETEEDVQAFIEAALEEAPDDAQFFAHVLGIAARARNVSDLARSTGIARETLYKMMRGEGNPTMNNVSKLANALGYRLSLVPLAAGVPGKPQRPVKRGVSRKSAVA